MRIKLPCGRNTEIDAEDAHLVEGMRLFSEKRGETFYVRVRRPKQRGGGKYLHNLITGGMIDHRDGDGLNNKRLNLRRCTQQQNNLNSRPKKGKKYKGVYRARRKFYVQITSAGKTKSLFGFETEEEAARAYDKLARELHGRWAWLNFPDSNRIDPRQEALL